MISPPKGSLGASILPVPTSKVKVPNKIFKKGSSLRNQKFRREPAHITGYLTAMASISTSAGQTRQSLENVKAVLAQAGLGMENIIKTTVFLKDMNDFAAMNEVYASFFPSEPPARSAVEVARAQHPHSEISAEGRIPPSGPAGEVPPPEEIPEVECKLYHLAGLLYGDFPNALIEALHEKALVSCAPRASILNPGVINIDIPGSRANNHQIIRFHSRNLFLRALCPAAIGKNHPYAE